MRENRDSGMHFVAVMLVLAMIIPSMIPSPMLSADTGTGGSGAALNVVATVSVLQDFVREIGQDRITCTALVTGMENPHTYATTTADRVAIEEASVFVEFGGAAGPELEPWAQDLLDSSDNNNLLVCEAASGIPLIDNNPHVWMNPENAKKMVINIENALIEADPGGADFYRNNTVAYLQSINETEERILAELAPYNGTKVIASHPAFLYFFDFIGFQQVDLLIDVPGQSPSAQHVSEIIEEMKEQNISLIVTMPQFPTPVTDQIEEETGAKSVEITPLIGAFNTTTYLGMLEYDSTAIRGTLAGSGDTGSRGENTALMYAFGLVIIGIIAGAAIYRRRRKR